MERGGRGGGREAEVTYLPPHKSARKLREAEVDEDVRLSVRNRRRRVKVEGGM